MLRGQVEVLAARWEREQHLARLADFAAGRNQQHIVDVRAVRRGEGEVLHVGRRRCTGCLPSARHFVRRCRRDDVDCRIRRITQCGDDSQSR